MFVKKAWLNSWFAEHNAKRMNATEAIQVLYRYTRDETSERIGRNPLNLRRSYEFKIHCRFETYVYSKLWHLRLSYEFRTYVENRPILAALIMSGRKL